MSEMPSSIVDGTMDGIGRPAAGNRVPKLSLSPERLRVWGLRSALALFDQGFTSATGFGVNYLLARWLQAEIYGAFAVSFAGFLFVAGFHNVILLEPLSVIGPSRYPESLREYFGAQIAVHLILVGVFSAVVFPANLVLWRVYPSNPLSGSVTGCCLALPFLLLLWLARRMCYAQHRPGIAVAGSIAYFSVVILGLFLLHHTGNVSPINAFLLMGSASFIAACILLRQIGVTATSIFPRSMVLCRTAIRENWAYGRWLVGSAALFSIANQTQTFLVAGFFGLGAAGILRAMQIPSLLMTQIIGAISLLVLPAFSHDFGRGFVARLRQKALFSSIFLAAMAGCFAILLIFLAAPAEHLLFGGKYSHYAWLIPIFAIMPVATAASVGSSSALRASQKTHFDLIANAVAAPVCILSALGFMHWWGLAGAAISMVLSTATTSVVTWLFFYQQPRDLAGQGS